MSKGIKRLLKVACRNVNREIILLARQPGKYSGPMSGEGYVGGYRAALNDVWMALNGVQPTTRGWWEDREDKT